MNIHFLGGTEEIGASSLLIETAGRSLLVDCGIRFRTRDALPDLDILQQHGGPDAVFITHGHLDHIGALPILHRKYPNVPIYATPPTIDLARIMLLDAAKLMNTEESKEEEIPLYSRSTVSALLDSMIPIQPDLPETPADDIKVTYFLCGHIIGAASVGIESPDGRVLVTGDFSWSDQMSVSGMGIPAFRPDQLIIESTYGDRMHAKRARQEKEFVQQVAETIHNGGKVLIPAFAVGRAQEVLLILRRAIRTGHIPRFPIWVDGLVKPVCTLYTRHPAYVKPGLRRLIEKTGDPFFNELDEIQPVTTNEERKKLLNGPPCVVVASSGMLSGGASVFYAKKILGEEKSLITITGYQDEETPGGQLLAASNGETAALTLQGAKYEIKCGIQKYFLSAHADASEIVGLAARLKPADTILVHGHEQGREKLSDQLAPEPVGRIHTPAQGQTLAFSGRKRTLLTNTKPIGNGTPFAEGIEKLAAHVLALRGEKASWQIAHLLRLWGETELSLEEAETVLIDSGLFQRNRVRPFSVKPAAGMGDGGTPQFKDPVQELVQRFAGSRGLYKHSTDRVQRHITLRFHYPKIAEQHYQEEIKAILQPLDWTYTIHPSPHTGVLVARAKKLLAQEGRNDVKISIHLEKDEVVARLPAELHSEQVKKINALFLRETGLSLSIAVNPGTCQPRQKRRADGRYEINAAFNCIEKHFQNAPHKPYKKRLIGQGANAKIELLFISPQIGERYREKLKEIEDEIGWNIGLGGNANQHRIKEIAITMVEDAGFALLKSPSYFGRRNLVVMPLTRPPDNKTLTRLQEGFRLRTGFDLEVET